MDAIKLVSTLNNKGKEHGVGRVDIIENRLVGIKTRGVCKNHPLEQFCISPIENLKVWFWTVKHCILKELILRPVFRVSILWAVVLGFEKICLIVSLITLSNM